MSSPAPLTRACSDVLNVDIESGSASTASRIVLIDVVPVASGTMRSTTASANDLAGM